MNVHFVAEIHDNDYFKKLLIFTNDVTQNNEIFLIQFLRKLSQNGCRNSEIFVNGLASQI
jgi:hypothetical protein